jgi:N-carbamoyl-L-amino-acid hydrolase
VGKVDPAIRAALTRAADALGIPTMPLGSPASHDAAAFAACGVPMGMIFVRNANGSHNPHEAMTLDDFLDGTAVLTQWLIEALC